MIGGHAGEREPARAAAVVVERVEQRKRDVDRIVGERERGARARLLGRLRVGDARGQRGERRQPALAVDPRGGVGDHREHAADPAAVVADRAARQRAPAALDAAAARQRQVQVLDRERGAALDARELGVDRAPERGDRVADRSPERVGMLVAERAGEAVVVEHAQLGSPQDEHRARRLEHHLDREAQALRPALDRPDRGRRPVDRPHALARFAAARRGVGEVRKRAFVARSRIAFAFVGIALEQGHACACESRAYGRPEVIPSVSL